MKQSKKPRVSWPSDRMLFQVKLFIRDDCPAKISCHQSFSKPNSSPNLLPPGFERTQYAAAASRRSKISHIPRIKWKKPPKFIINDALLVGSGGESKERRDENLRIDKVLEAFYPHRSVIPIRPSVSPNVEMERYDDSKTPNIRLTPIEDEPEETAASSPELPSPTKKVLPPPAIVSGLGPELNLALTALKEHGSNVDTDLLFKLLSDPKIVENLLLNDTIGKPLETADNKKIPNTNINISKPSLVPQLVPSSSPMDIRNPSPKPIGLTRNVPVSVQSSVSVATTTTNPPPLLKTIQPPVSNPLSMKPCSVLNTYPLSTGLKPLPRTQDSYQTALVRPSSVDAVLVSVSEQKTVPKPQSESARTGTDSQIGNATLNQVDEVPAKPVKNLDYFKNLIREHGGVVIPPAASTTKETNNYKGRRVGNNNNNIKVMKKVQKQCMYFGRGRGCKLGESCLFIHDQHRAKRFWSTDVVAAGLPREAKRLKF